MGSQLRPYQSAALSQWEGADRRGIVCLPTGGGKTRLAAAAIATTSLPTLCVVPTRILLHQWVQVLREALACPIGALGDGLRDIRPITVATYESAWRQMSLLSAQFGLLVIDEVHHFGEGKRDELLEMACAPFRLGLTATPPLERSTCERLHTLVGPIVFEMAMEELSGKWLAPVRFSKIFLALTREEQGLYDISMTTFRDFQSSMQLSTMTWKEFASLAIRNPKGREALTCLRRAKQIASWNGAKQNALRPLLLQYAHRRPIVFTADTKSAYDISRKFLLPCITANISKSERDMVLAAFERGTLPALVTCRVLNEGYDLPSAGVAIIVSGSGCAREFVQRVGRVLRPAPQKQALIVELVTKGTTEEKQSHQRNSALRNR